MSIYSMLQELRRMVDSEELIDDDCPHVNPADNDDWCAVCFIFNLSEHVSEDPRQFLEETTEVQRDKIVELWEEHANSFYDEDENTALD